jgi:hypothetical protein
MQISSKVIKPIFSISSGFFWWVYSNLLFKKRSARQKSAPQKSHYPFIAFFYGVLFISNAQFCIIPICPTLTSSYNLNVPRIIRHTIADHFAVGHYPIFKSIHPSIHSFIHSLYDSMWNFLILHNAHPHSSCLFLTFLIDCCHQIQITTPWAFFPFKACQQTWRRRTT